MSRVSNFTAMATVVAVVAAMGCQAAPSSNKNMTADLERDLNLASSVQRPRSGVVSALELNGNGGPSGNERGRRLAVPTEKRAPVAAESPIVAEAPVAPAPTEQATSAPAETSTQATAASTQAAAETPAPEVIEGVFLGTATSGPSAGSASAGDNGSGNTGHGINGRAIGMAIAGVAGAIIRGAAAGDNCEPVRPGQRGALGRGPIGEMIGRGQGPERTPTPQVGGTPARYPRY